MKNDIDIIENTGKRSVHMKRAITEFLPVLRKFRQIKGEVITPAEVNNYCNLLYSKRVLDIESVKIDLFNKVDKWVIALTHGQPLHVIEDIIAGNYCKETGVVDSKIYTTLELVTITNRSSAYTTEKMRRLSENYQTNGDKYYLGHVVRKNITTFMNSVGGDTILIGKKRYYTHKKTLELFDITTNDLTPMMNKGDTFGVNIKYAHTDSKRRRVYLCKDVDKARNRQHLYIKTTTMDKYITLSKFEKFTLRNTIDMRYGDFTKISNAYILISECLFINKTIDKVIGVDVTSRLLIFKEYLEESITDGYLSMDYTKFKYSLPNNFTKNFKGVVSYGVTFNVSQSRTVNRLSRKKALELINAILIDLNSTKSIAA